MAIATRLYAYFLIKRDWNIWCRLRRCLRELGLVFVLHREVRGYGRALNRRHNTDGMLRLILHTQNTTRNYV